MLSAESDIVYKHQERHRIALTYMLIYFFGHYDHCLIRSLSHQYSNTCNSCDLVCKRGLSHVFEQQKFGIN